MKEKIKNQAFNDIKTLFKDIEFKVIGIMFLWSIVVNLIIEIMGQFKYGGFFEAFVTLAHHPLVFLFNVIIIMVTLSVSLLFKRTYFCMAIISLIWIALGITNCIVLSCRVTPFSAVELKLVDAALGVMNSYISVAIILAVVIAVILAVALILFLWKKAPIRTRVNYFSSIFIIVCLIIILEGATIVGLKTNIISTKLTNLSESYVDYGFVYCFSNSLINTGISKPKGYSKEKVAEIKVHSNEKINGSPSAVTASEESVSADSATCEAVDVEKLPNIIFLQLESFFDITDVGRLKFSEDPIPFFRQCMEKYSSGYLSVPVVGAGTANTEFEAIAGINLDFFGPGEYPYKTVLKDNTCETICYNLKPYGYTTQAIHNNRANFYGRNVIFSHLGFDYFTSMELMNIQEYTPNGWAKDSILTEEIIKSLSNTESKDFIYTISVQAHGGYPTTEIVSGDSVIEVTDGYISESEKYATEYYVNQIHEMDEFLVDLTDNLQKYKDETGEDVILVAYGDHLPTLYFEEDELNSKNQYLTQYFVWNTMNLPVVKEDLEAYQVNSRILETLKIRDGEINSFHQANKEEAKEDPEKYNEDLKMLCYDMFYGDSDDEDDIINENVYEPTEIKYGVVNVSLNSVYRDQSDNEYLIIKGDNFTNYSSVYIDDEEIESEFLDQNTIRISIPKIEKDVDVCVKQTYKGSLILQTSNIIRYTAQEDINGIESDELKNESDDNGNSTDEQNKDWIGVFSEKLNSSVLIH